MSPAFQVRNVLQPQCSIQKDDICVSSYANFASKPEDSFALSCNNYYVKQVAIFLWLLS
jgi:hypothetical protein